MAEGSAATSETKEGAIARDIAALKDEIVALIRQFKPPFDSSRAHAIMHCAGKIKDRVVDHYAPFPCLWNEDTGNPLVTAAANLYWASGALGELAQAYHDVNADIAVVDASIAKIKRETEPAAKTE